jgi:hypothetical protein
MAYDRMLVHIRERSFLDLLDLSLIIVRHRPGSLALAAVAGIAPCAALNFWLLSDVNLTRPSWIPLLFLEAPWATAPLTLVLGGLMFDRPPRPGSILRRIVISLPILVFTQFFLRGLLGLSVILIPLIPSRLWFLNEVILLERAQGLKAIRRCSQLCRKRAGELFAQWIGQIFLGLLFVLCFWMGTGAGISALVKNELTWDGPMMIDPSSLRFQLGAWIAIAFFGVSRFLIYLDERIRSEGWELKLRLQAVGRDLEVDRR